MTTLEQFIGAFNVKFYAATSVSSMGWTNEELCEFFNSAQLQLIEELAGMGNIDAISDLVTESGEIDLSAPIFSLGTYKYKVDVATNLEDYFYYLSGTLGIRKSNPVEIGKEEDEEGNKVFEAFPLDKISIKDVPNFTATTDNVTFFKRPKIALGSDTSSKLTIVIDAFTTDMGNLVINYISKPRSFKTTADSEPLKITNLNEALHNRIVSLAVEIAVRTMVNTQNSNQ
jgi:hypothetical protein